MDRSMKRPSTLAMLAWAPWRAPSPPPHPYQARPRYTRSRFGIASLPRRSGATSPPLRADVPGRDASPLLKEGGSVFITALAFGSVAMKKAGQRQDDAFALSLLALGFARRHRGFALSREVPLSGPSPDPLHAIRRAGSAKSLWGFCLRKAASRSKGTPLRRLPSTVYASIHRPWRRSRNRLI